MPTPTEALIHYLQQRDVLLDRRYLREALHTLTQAIMESEVSQMLDAALYERNSARRAYRNGYRSSTWSTPVGDIQLDIPKLRKGSYYPTFLNTQIAERLLKLAQIAYVEGVQYTDVAAALQPMTDSPLRGHDIADIAQRLDDLVYNAQHGPLQTDYPYLLLDLIDVDRDDRRQWRQIALVFGIESNGDLHLLTHEIMASYDDRVWLRLLRRLRERNLDDPQAVISDDLWGARHAVETAFVSAVWEHQRDFRQRTVDALLVNAVSNLFVRVGSDHNNLPRMQWIAPPPGI